MCSLIKVGRVGLAFVSIPACEQLPCDCQSITDPTQRHIQEAFVVGLVPLDCYVGEGLAEPALTGGRELPAKNRC